MTDPIWKNRSGLEESGSQNSTYSSSVYSEHSSTWAVNTAQKATESALDNDENLIPRPLDIARKASQKLEEEGPGLRKISFLIDHSPNDTSISSPSSATFPRSTSLRQKSASAYQVVDSELYGFVPNNASNIATAWETHGRETSVQESEDALLREIIRYPMTNHSPNNRLTTPPHKESQSLLVSKKAAKVLGLDGSGSQCGSPVTPSTPVCSENVKELPNYDPTFSSPSSLRKIASKLTLTTRKKSLKTMDLTIPENEPMPDPVKIGAFVEGTPTSSTDLPLKSAVKATRHLQSDVQKDFKPLGSSSCSASTTKGSISKRRGFRPLSIHTGKAFDPFDEKSVLAVKGHDLEKETCAAAPLQSNIVVADFATLASSTPPDLKDHPLFQVDPFSSKSASPLLKTTSTPHEIRKISSEIRQNRSSSGIDSSTGSKGSSTSNRKLLFPNLLKESIEENAPDSFELRSGGSPLSKKWEAAESITHKPLPRIRDSASVGSAANSGTNSAEFNGAPKWPYKNGSFRQDVTTGKPENGPVPLGLGVRSGASAMTPTESSFEDGVEQRRSRGLSNWFRQLEIGKDIKLDKRKISTGQNLDLRSQSEAQREAEIAYLRRAFNAPSPKYDEGDTFPRHPNTGGSWKSRNLKCTTCLDSLCDCCGRTCCTFKRAYLAAESPLSPQHIKEEAQELMDRISRVFPYGREIPTFLQCTHGGGCGRLVCPECIGRCPLSHCEDTQCKKCKKDPWAICDFHTEAEIRFGAKALPVQDASEIAQD